MRFKRFKIHRNGHEWWKLRSAFQKGFSSPQNVRQFLPRADEVIKEFMDFIPSRVDEENIVKDMVGEFERLNLELTCLIAFDERLECFSKGQRKSNSKSSRLIDAATEINSNVLPTEQGFMLWRYFETKEFKKTRIAQEFLQKVAMDFIEKRIKLKSDGNSLLDQYLRNPNVDKKDIMGMSIDLLLAGIHTSSFTEGSALYHISNNHQIQELMHEEAKKFLPNPTDDVTPQILNSEIPYTRAVLKEVFRLNPISIGVGRILNQDTILSGYLVPKNVNF